jgi:tagaturonate epimerase
MKKLERLSFGVGDRFAHQAAAQLRAFQLLANDGVHLAPVWNKSNREHLLVGSEPPSVRQAAKLAVENTAWTEPWHVDADHIRLDTVDRFLGCSDFFTLDVADSIGVPAKDEGCDEFIGRHPELLKTVAIPGIDRPFEATELVVRAIANRYLSAAQQAGKIYHHIASRLGEENFIAEVSMDETDEPQTPLQLLVILAALADEGIRVQTIAPKFTGRFNKGVDYVGDLEQFEREFADDIAVIAHAVRQYGLPQNLKLSVHSGSDKFSIYPIIQRVLRKTGAGLHLKTAGTTWLEELIGLAESGGNALAFVKELYREALEHFDELCAPYSTVIDVHQDRLPSAEAVADWSGERMAAAIRHDQTNADFDPGMRQLMHVAFKLAAKRGRQFLDLLETHEEIIGRNVTFNLYNRHMRPLFVQ